METKYLVIGGGITGLSFASGLKENDFYILEKEKDLGGYCRTIKEKGFVWDYAGHFFHFHNEKIRERFTRLLNSDNIVYNQKNTKIYYKGQYIDYPFQYNIHQLYKEEFIDCLVGLFENEGETEAENFEEMLHKRYGRAISDKFLKPYNEKLYACNLNTLDVDAMGRFFPDSRPEEIIRGFRTKQQGTYNDEFLYAKQGAVAFVDALCQELSQERLLTGTEVLKIDIEKQEVYTSKGIFRYQYLINTMPLDQFLERSTIEHEINFNYNQVLVFNLGFDSAPENNDCHWIYYPDKEFCFYRVGFYNNILHSDKMSLYVELGFPKEQEIQADLWEEQVLRDLRKVGIITGQKLIASNHIEMCPAYVHITRESQEEIKRLSDRLNKRNIFSIGRYGAWTYCSIEDCIQQADKLRNDIVEK